MFFGDRVRNPLADVCNQMQKRLWNFEARFGYSGCGRDLRHEFLIRQIFADENVLASWLSSFEREPESAHAIMNVNEARAPGDINGPHTARDITNRFSNWSRAIVPFTDD